MAFMGRGGFPSIKNTGGARGGGGYHRDLDFIVEFTIIYQ